MVETKTKKVQLNADELKFDEKGLIVAIAQDYESGEVLMQAFMNREAVEKTMETATRIITAVPARRSGKRARRAATPKRW